MGGKLGLTFQKVGCQPERSLEEAAMAASDRMLTILRYRMGTARFSRRMTASSSTQRQALSCRMGVLGHTYTIAVHISSYLQEWITRLTCGTGADGRHGSQGIPQEYTRDLNRLCTRDMPSKVMSLRK